MQVFYTLNNVNKNKVAFRNKSKDKKWIESLFN
jgi:hypothetical protein